MASWDRQRGEPFLWYSRFLIFRDLGMGERTFIRVSELTGASRQRIDVQAKKWNWHDRVDKWDAFLLSIRDRAAQEEAEEIGRESVRSLRRLLERASTALEDYDVAKITFREITQAIRVSTSGLRAEGMLRNARTDPQIEDARLVIETLPAHVRIPLVAALEDFARSGEGEETGSAISGDGAWSEEDE